MRSYAFIFTLLLSFPLIAQDISRIPDTLSGTVVVAKSKRISKEVVFVESDYTMVEKRRPIRSNLKKDINSIALYSMRADAFNKGYKIASEFKVRISKSDSIILLSSESKLVTQDMLKALNRMQKEGGTATFYAIKVQRNEGTVPLPSFKYSVPKPAASGADLAERAKN